MMKVVILKAFFFSFFYPAAVYQSDDDSAISAAVEVLMKSSLSSLTQGYGSIMLSTLFLHHKLLSLSPHSTSTLSPTLLLLSVLLEIRAPFVFF